MRWHKNLAVATVAAVVLLIEPAAVRSASTANGEGGPDPQASAPERTLTPAERAARQRRIETEGWHAAANAAERAAAALKRAEAAADAAEKAAAEAERARKQAHQAYTEAEAAAEAARHAAQRPAAAGLPPAPKLKPVLRAQEVRPQAGRSAVAQSATLNSPHTQRPASPVQTIPRRQSLPSTAPDRQSNLPASVTGANLAECVKKLDAQGSGWCEMGKPISSVWPTKLSYYDSLRGMGGPRDILVAWNGMAFDRQGKKLYFVANGGHGGWQGNGVYEFDLSKGKWTRLVDPRPLSFILRPNPNDPSANPHAANAPYGTFIFNKGQKTATITDPAFGPTSSHTYDGVQFSSKTRTIFWYAGIYGAPYGMFYSNKELWEFNPSPSETRNGLKPLSWRMHHVKLGGWPTFVELPNGDLFAGANFIHGWRFDPANPEATLKPAGGLGADYGDGNLIYDPVRRVMWFLSKYGIFQIPPNGHGTKFAPPAAGFGIGGAVRKGKIITWDGRNFIGEFDPETKQFSLFDWTGKKPGKGDGKVYSKWVYLPKEDVFVGVTDESTGILVYKHPDSGGVRTTTVDPQHFIDAARPGGTAIIPPGLYIRGLVIKKSLTVKMAGARFIQPVGGRGTVWVDNPGGPVVLDGLTADEPPYCHTNCAGVRVQGRNYDVTIRNATILNQEMGVLTSNVGGRLVIENSVIGKTSGADPSSLSHVIYAGYSDELIIRHSKIFDSNGLGHLVKSRAARTVIEDSQILGDHGRQSRVVDISCGGDLFITGSTLQQSDQTDNTELMMIGGEKLVNCEGKPTRPSKVVIKDSVIESWRDRSKDEPAWQDGPTGLIRWRAPGDPSSALILHNVKFKNIDILVFAERGRPGLPIP